MFRKQVHYSKVHLLMSTSHLVSFQNIKGEKSPTLSFIFLLSHALWQLLLLMKHTVTTWGEDSIERISQAGIYCYRPGPTRSSGSPYIAKTSSKLSQADEFLGDCPAKPHYVLLFPKPPLSALSLHVHGGAKQRNSNGFFTPSQTSQRGFSGEHFFSWYTSNLNNAELLVKRSRI